MMAKIPAKNWKTRMRILICLAMLVLFVSCEQNTPRLPNLQKDIEMFALEDLSAFEGYTMQQGIRCMISFEAPQGVRGIFLGVPRKKEIMERFDNAVIVNLMNLCRKENIYSFKSVDSSFIIRTNNCYFTYNQLKQDTTYYDDNIRSAGLGRDQESVKLGLCYLIGNSNNLRDSLSKSHRIYKYNEVVYYFWKLMPPVFNECKDGLTGGE